MSRIYSRDLAAGGLRALAESHSPHSDGTSHLEADGGRGFPCHKCRYFRDGHIDEGSGHLVDGWGTCARLFPMYVNTVGRGWTCGHWRKKP